MLQLIDIEFSFHEKSKKDKGAEISIGNKTKTLQNISLHLEQGAVVAVMGESGCGKSTLLNLIYGLLQPDTGKIMWNGKELLGPDHHLVPGHPMIKYVPQEFNLMPYTTVFENVGEHLSIQLDDRGQTIHRLLEVVEMETYADRKVKTLSGGQKQRVAIAKALAQQPQLLLLDEPFSHVDNFRKNTLRRRLFKYLKEENISALIATHDRNDVLSFTDESVIMKAGHIVDHRSTREVYHDPKDVYGATLFDDINVLPTGMMSNTKDILLYPHQLEIANAGYETVVVNCYFKGDSYLIECKSAERTFWVKSQKELSNSSIVYLKIK